MKKIIMCLLATLTTIASAQSIKPIEIVNPYPPGGAADMNARVLSKVLSLHGYTNIVTYYPGADGDIGYKHAMSKKDNVIMIGAHANLIFSHVVQRRSNHHADTLVLIGPTTKSAQGFITSMKGFKSYKDLVDTAKLKELPCGVGSSAGTAELLRLNQEYKTKFVPVVYKGTGPLVNDLAGDHIQCALETLASHYPRHEGNQVKILSSSFANKINVPLVNTQLPVEKLESWYAFAIPKNGNLLQDEKLIKVLKELTSNKDIMQELVDQGYVAATIDPKLNDFIRRQSDYYNSLMK